MAENNEKNFDSMIEELSKMYPQSRSFIVKIIDIVSGSILSLNESIKETNKTNSRLSCILIWLNIVATIATLLGLYIVIKGLV